MNTLKILICLIFGHNPRRINAFSSHYSNDVQCNRCYAFGEIKNRGIEWNKEE